MGYGGVGLGWCWLCQRLGEGDSCDGGLERWVYCGGGLGRVGLMEGWA